MILATPFGNREIRGEEFTEHPVSRSGAVSYAGRYVSVDVAAGLPAVASAVLRVSELIASLPVIVYRGGKGVRERATGTWQWDLLHRAPNRDQSPAEYFQDVAAGVESCGNSFSQKLRARGRVTELVPLDPETVRCYRDAAGRKSFDVWTRDGVVKGLTTADILHVRGPTIKGGLVGLSPIALHRHTLGNQVAMEEFLGNFFLNDARPGVVLKFPERINAAQAEEYLEAWNARHAGAGNHHRASAVGGGADVEVLPVSLDDAQFVESMRYGVADVARIYRLPRSILEEGEIGDTAQEVERLAKFSLFPRLRRIEQAFAADPDLFGSGDLLPEFLMDALERPDTRTRYDAYRLARQGGWVTANELRARENLTPLDGGDELQQTPVGGAPNPPAPQE